MAKNTRTTGQPDSSTSEYLGSNDGSDGGDDSSTSTDGAELPNVTGDPADTSEYADPLAGIGTGAGTGTKDPGKSGTRSGDVGGRSGRSSAQGGRKNQKTVDLKGAGNKALALQIVGLHHIAGILTGAPAICAITMEQGEALTAAVSEVMAQYKIKPNPKVTAWLNLAGVVGIVYIPKALAFKELAAAKRKHAAPVQTSAPLQTDTTETGTGVLKFG